jgi:hypothetical protein
MIVVLVAKCLITVANKILTIFSFLFCEYYSNAEHLPMSLAAGINALVPTAAVGIAVLVCQPKMDKTQ